MDGWRTKDKTWMEEREKSWEQLETKLKYEAETKAELKQWRSYYLTGKLSKNSKLELIDKLWMHPDQNEAAWGKVCDDATIGQVMGAISHLMDKSRHGYMKGIDGPLLQFLLGDDIDKGIIRFKDEHRVTSQTVFFDRWRRRAFLWLYQPYDVDDCFCPYTIDFFFSMLPHMPPEYFGLEIKNHDEVNREHKLMILYSEIGQCHKLFYYLLWFVEPRGLKGEDTPVRRFAESMKREMETRELPRHVKNLWEYLKTDEARFLHPELDDNKHTWEYWSLVHHQDSPIDDPLSYIRTIHQTFEQLELSQAPFEPENIESVELNKHLSAKFSRTLGFEKVTSIPGYRYRIQTNNTFVNSPSHNDSIDLDVIVFSHPSGYNFIEDIPVAMMIPRPAMNYYYMGNHYYRFKIYQLNYRLVWRTLAEQCNLIFKRYEKFESDEENRWKYNAEPQVDVSYFPLKSGAKALLNTPKKDFPILKDSPLPSLV